MWVLVVFLLVVVFCAVVSWIMWRMLCDTTDTDRTILATYDELCQYIQVLPHKTWTLDSMEIKCTDRYFSGFIIILSYQDYIRYLLNKKRLRHDMYTQNISKFKSWGEKK